MSSIEIAKRRKALENEFQLTANLLTGQLTGVRAKFEEEIEKLQKECSHIWDSGENAVQKLEVLSICTICRKKFKL